MFSLVSTETKLLQISIVAELKLGCTEVLLFNTSTQPVSGEKIAQWREDWRKAFPATAKTHINLSG